LALCRHPDRWIGGRAHAFLVIRFKVDQVVSGVAINIFGAGMTSFISSRFMQKALTNLNNSGTFPSSPFPIFQDPRLGPIFLRTTLSFTSRSCS
jgi:general nucleoside transport system permease protein